VHSSLSSQIGFDKKAAIHAWRSNAVSSCGCESPCACDRAPRNCRVIEPPPYPVELTDMHKSRPVAPYQLVLIGLGLLVGCAKSHDVSHLDRDADERPNEDGDAPLAPDNGLCARLAEIDCDAEQRCCSKVTRTSRSCQNELRQNCAQTLYLDDIAAEAQSAFDSAAAESAFLELADRASRCDVSVLRWLPSEKGLRSIFRGALQTGQGCNPAGGVTGSPGGVAAALSSCVHADDLACLPQGLLGEWTCAPKQATGQPCITEDNCADNGACNNFDQPSLGVCVERLPLGAACAFGAECESLYCKSEECREPDMDGVYCLKQ
jgi:hypothetical protein